MTLEKLVKFILITLFVLLITACSSSAESNQTSNPQRGGPGRNAQGQGPMMIMNIVSEATGLDVETIREQSANGATLAEIITANGGDVEEVKAKLIEAMMKRPNASEEDVEQRIEEMLNNPLPQRNFQQGRSGVGNNN